MAELRYIPNFPKEGITFIDITPKLSDKDDLNKIIDEMCKNVPENVDYIIAPEARGYIFGTPMAAKLGVGFIPIRKRGKLPDDLVYMAEYEKEYGVDVLCLPKNEGYEGKNFYIVDDVLATGGTLRACKELIKQCKGNYIGAGMYIKIKGLSDEEVSYLIEVEE